MELIGEIDCKYIEEANCITKTPLFKWVALAACVALCLCGTLVGQFVYQAHYTEVSYICLDVNPSFELCLNHENLVINAIAYNDDGKELMDKIDYKNKHYEDVINDIFHHDSFQEYLTENLTITIVSKDDTEIQERIEHHMESAKCDGKILCSDSLTRETAYSNHCSVGKYIAYEELSQYNQDITLEECKGMTMHEIYEEIDKHHNTHHDVQDTHDSIEKQNGGHSDSSHHTKHH